MASDGVCHLLRDMRRSNWQRLCQVCNNVCLSATPLRRIAPPPRSAAHCTVPQPETRTRMFLSAYERLIIKRYLLPVKGEGFIFVAAIFSFVAVLLGVAALVIVMSVMNGFRAELFDKIVGLNGHAVVQGYGGRLTNWRDVLDAARETPGVTSARPLIEQPLLANANGRVEAVLVRGMDVADIRSNAVLGGKVLAGDLDLIGSGSGQIAIGSQLAQNIGAQVGSTMTIINPAGRSTPFGTVPREIGYTVGAIFEIGVFEFDKAYVVMPMADAQTLLLTGDAVGMIEIKTEDADRVTEILQPLAQSVAGRAQVTSWQQMNASLFEALAVERVAMFVVLSIIILVAAFNIVSSLIMLVQTRTRDIAILRTIGAERAAVLRIFLTIGTTIGFLGTAAGLLVGFVFLFFRQQVVVGIQWLTGQNLWDPSIRFLTELPSKPDLFEIVAISVMAVLFSFLAALYPALRAANTDPVQVLRYE
jgi:lipoprotein-releasing system permease protein